MVKPLIIQKDNQTTLFDVSLLDRRKLYGSRKRVALDTQARHLLGTLAYRHGPPRFVV